MNTNLSGIGLAVLTVLFTTVSAQSPLTPSQVLAQTLQTYFPGIQAAASSVNTQQLPALFNIWNPQAPAQPLNPNQPNQLTPTYWLGQPNVTATTPLPNTQANPFGMYRPTLNTIADYEAAIGVASCIDYNNPPNVWGCGGSPCCPSNQYYWNGWDMWTSISGNATQAAAAMNFLVGIVQSITKALLYSAFIATDIVQGNGTNPVFFENLYGLAQYMTQQLLFMPQACTNDIGNSQFFGTQLCTPMNPPASFSKPNLFGCSNPNGCIVTLGGYYIQIIYNLLNLENFSGNTQKQYAFNILSTVSSALPLVLDQINVWKGISNYYTEEIAGANWSPYNNQQALNSLKEALAAKELPGYIPGSTPSLYINKQASGDSNCVCLSICNGLQLTYLGSSLIQGGGIACACQQIPGQAPSADITTLLSEYNAHYPNNMTDYCLTLEHLGQ